MFNTQKQLSSVYKIVAQHITLLFSILFLASPLFSFTVMATQKITYTVGVVPQFGAQRIHEIWEPVLNELQRLSGLQFKFVGSANIPKFEQQFMAGKFDISYMNPYHLLIANKEQGYLPIIRDHGKMLSGILVIHKDNPIKIIEELDARTLAFPSPNALGASLLMRTELYTKYNININSRYVKTHDSVYMNVVLGLVAAGGGVEKTFNKQPKNIRDKLRVFYHTTMVNPHPIAIHPRVPQIVRQKIQKAFLQIGQSPSGEKLLSKIPIKIIGPTVLSDYLSLGGMGIESFYVH